MPNPYVDPNANMLTTNAFTERIMSQSFKKMADSTGMPPKLTTTAYEDREV